MRQRQDQYIVRFPPGMRDQIKVNAVLNRRSMNAEIIHQLERALGVSPKLVRHDEVTPVSRPA